MVSRGGKGWIPIDVLAYNCKGAGGASWEPTQDGKKIPNNAIHKISLKESSLFFRFIRGFREVSLGDSGLTCNLNENQSEQKMPA